MVNGSLLILGYAGEPPKKSAFAVFAVEGATANPVSTKGGAAFAPAKGDLQPLLYSTNTPNRHAAYFLSEGKLHTLESHVVSDPIPWPRADFVLQHDSFPHWTGSALTLTDGQSKEVYVLVDNAFAPVRREKNESVIGKLASVQQWWTRDYLVLRADRGEHVECLRIEGATAKPVEFPKDTKSYSLFAVAVEVFAIHEDQKSQFCILKLDGLTATRAPEARRAGKLGRLSAFPVGDEYRVAEWAPGSDESRNWRFTVDAVVEMKPPEGWEFSTGVAWKGVALNALMPVETKPGSSAPRVRLGLTDAKGNTTFVQQEGQPWESEWVMLFAAADGFYVKTKVGDGTQLIYIPRD